jgi:hypothetical protein
MIRWKKPKKFVIIKRNTIKVIPVLVIAIVAAVGVYLLLAAHATSTYTRGEAENGTLGGSAAVTPDTSASNGTAVTFGTKDYIVPSTIADNCSTDVSGALNAWIASVPNNSTIEFPANACYGITSSLVINNRSNVTLDGNNGQVKLLTTTANSAYNLSVWKVAGGSNITFTNMNLYGDNPDTGGDASNASCNPDGPLEYQYGIDFQGTHTGGLYAVNINNVCGDFVEVESQDDSAGDDIFADYSSNITIYGGTFNVAGRQGIAITNGDTVNIGGATIEDVAQDAIDVETDVAQEYATNIDIANNNFKYIAGGLLANFGAGGSPNVGTMTFKNNTQTNPLTCNPLIWGGTPSGSTTRTNYVITGNQLDPYYAMVNLTSVNDVTISNNTDSGAAGNGGCSNSGVYPGVILDGVNTATITNNNFGSAVNAIDQITGGSGLVACSNEDAEVSTFSLPTVCN